MRYFLKLAYDGTPYHGWQRQPNASSVQETIERALSTMMQRDVEIVGAGRTDTGVHARAMYAHFDSDPIENKGKFLQSLNRLCGQAIAIKEVLDVVPEAHARFDAKSRTYQYHLIGEKDPFLSDYAWEIGRMPDHEKMNEAATLLLETEDFTSFAKLHSDAKTNICDVTHARWEKTGEHGLVFTITADRFLRNMVRAVVGTLLEVGNGKISISEFKEIIEKKNRCDAGVSVPAKGLFLTDIVYSPEIFI